MAVVIYLAVVQGSTTAGHSLSFGPSRFHDSFNRTGLLTKHADVAQAFAAANRIRSMRPQGTTEIEELSLDLSDLDNGEKGPHGVKIELKNINFKYPTRDVPVLRNLNMTVSIKNISRIILTLSRSKKGNSQP